MAGMEGRVVSLETGEDVNPGEEGEILLRGLTLSISVFVYASVKARSK